MTSCFNPLHCGAVVASIFGVYLLILYIYVSIPFIAGQWSLPPLTWEEGPRAGEVSIPFIAGQWSLRSEPGDSTTRSKTFQSPSLRGSGRFGTRRSIRSVSRRAFQSPSLRGSGRFASRRRPTATGGARVSIPFIAGLWSLLVTALPPSPPRPPFNPLHCGAVVASRRGGDRRRDQRHRPSIPFIAGQWSLLGTAKPGSLRI